MYKNIVYWRTKMVECGAYTPEYYHFAFMAAHETKTWRKTHTLTLVKS